MASLELYVQWNVYDENGEILEIGDFVETYHDGQVGEGIISELFCLADEETAYIKIDPTNRVSSEVAEFLDEMRAIDEYDRIEKIE